MKKCLAIKDCEMKGIALIAGIVFLAIIIIAVALVYNISAPIIEKINDRAAIEKMKISMLELDDVIRTVYSEGNGSRREFAINIEKGKLTIENNTVYYNVNTNAKVISPRTMQRIGNLIFGSSLTVSAQKSKFSNLPAFLLENEHLKIYIKELGHPDSPVFYNTKDLFLAAYQKDKGEYLPIDFLEISVDNKTESTIGIGYTTLISEGSNLPYSEVVAFINTSYINYKITFTLESGADFIKIKGESLQ